MQDKTPAATESPKQAIDPEQAESTHLLNPKPYIIPKNTLSKNTCSWDQAMLNAMSLGAPGDEKINSRTHKLEWNCLYRMCTPNARGAIKVDKEIYDKWNSISHEQVYRMKKQSFLLCRAIIVGSPINENIIQGTEPGVKDTLFRDFVKKCYQPGDTAGNQVGI